MKFWIEKSCASTVSRDRIICPSDGQVGNPTHLSICPETVEAIHCYLHEMASGICPVPCCSGPDGAAPTPRTI